MDSIPAATEWLFFHLWKSNPLTGASCKNINIASTVLYRWGVPNVWYYTKQKNGVQRVTKDKIQKKKLTEVKTQFKRILKKEERLTALVTV